MACAVTAGSALGLASARGANTPETRNWIDGPHPTRRLMPLHSPHAAGPRGPDLWPDAHIRCSQSPCLRAPKSVMDIEHVPRDRGRPTTAT